MDTSPPATTTPLPYNQVPVLVSTGHGSGHIGPFFAMMSVILVLAALSCLLGRYCGSWAEGPDSWYDCVGWCKRRCGRSRRIALGCGGGEREVRTVVPSVSKVRESNQLSLPSPQP